MLVDFSTTGPYFITGEPPRADALLVRTYQGMSWAALFNQRDDASGLSYADIDPLLADTHAFEELRLLSQLRSRATTLNDEEMASLRRIIGGSGTDAASRLGLQPDPPYDGPRAAFSAAQRWRRRADHPLNDPFTTRACRAAVRSAEAMVADFAAQGR